MVPRSGVTFHKKLLDTVLRLVDVSAKLKLDVLIQERSPMSFFSTTDTGVTLNRFSQDLMLIDMELPVAALNTFASKFIVLGSPYW